MRNSTMSLSEKRYLHPLFIQEREEPANLAHTYHSHEESLLPAQSFFTRTSTGRPVYEPSPDFLKNGNQVATWKTSESGFSLKDKKSKFLLKSDLRSRSTNFKPSLIKEVSRNLLELLILSEWKFIILLQGVTNAGKINYYFKKTITRKSGSS